MILGKELLHVGMILGERAVTCRHDSGERAVRHDSGVKRVGERAVTCRHDSGEKSCYM